MDDKILDPNAWVPVADAKPHHFNDKIGLNYVHGSLHYSYTNVGMDVFNELYSHLITEAKVWFFLRKHWPDYNARLVDLNLHPELRAELLGVRGVADEWFYENYVKVNNDSVALKQVPGCDSMIADGEIFMVFAKSFLDNHDAEKREALVQHAITSAVLHRTQIDNPVSVGLSFTGTADLGDLFSYTPEGAVTTETWLLNIGELTDEVGIKAVFFGEEFVDSWENGIKGSTAADFEELQSVIDGLDDGEVLEFSHDALLATIMLTGGTDLADALCLGSTGQPVLVLFKTE